MLARNVTAHDMCGISVRHHVRQAIMCGTACSVLDPIFVPRCGAAALWRSVTAPLRHCGIAASWYCGAAIVRCCGPAAWWSGTTTRASCKAQRRSTGTERSATGFGVEVQRAPHPIGPSLTSRPAEGPGSHLAYRHPRDCTRMGRAYLPHPTDLGIAPSRLAIFPNAAGCWRSSSLRSIRLPSLRVERRLARAAYACAYWAGLQGCGRAGPGCCGMYRCGRKVAARKVRMRYECRRRTRTSPSRPPRHR